MQVNLQVVGLFYNVNLTVTDTDPTVQTLMDAAVATPDPAGSLNGASGFNYGTHLDNPTATATMSVMSATYKASFQSRVLGNHYPAGVYTLAESFDPTTPSPLYTVWQYYLFDESGTYMPPQSTSESFVTQPLTGVGRVTWRLVSILGGPTATIESLENTGARNPQRRAAAMS